MRPYISRLRAGAIEPCTGAATLPLEDVPYTVMKFVRGEPLDRLIQQRARLEPSRAVKIIMDVLAELACAHGHKVIHRDVKPDNIIIGTDVTYLIDFSTGICLEYRAGLSRPTGQGQVVGTLEYASKEQLKDSNSVDHRTDLYSAGLVLFEMLAGHSKIERPRIAAQLSGIPAGLHAVDLKACAADRERRYAVPAEFRQALEAYCDTLVWRATDPTLSLCPNPLCSGASSSQRGYLRGPRIEDSSANAHRENCGQKYIKNCPIEKSRCRRISGSSCARKARATLTAPQRTAEDAGLLSTRPRRASHAALS